jgi:type IV pilus assembly protein PilC
MLFRYIISTSQGQIQKGEIEAVDQAGAAETLRKRGLLIISLEEKRKLILKPEKILSLFGYISNLEKVTFTKHLALMLKAGLTLNDSLKILRDQTTSFQMKRIVGFLIKRVEEGQPLSAGLARYPRMFTAFYVNIVQAGEKSGTLEENLEHLAVQMMKDYELRRRVKSAMAYPIVVLSATIILGVSLALLVFPKLARLFKTFKVELPLLTRMLLDVTDFLQHWAVYTGLAIVVLIFILRWILRRKAIRPYFHKFILQIPIFGKVAQNLNLARFARILASLLKSGLPITQSLEITANTLNNFSFKISLKRVNQEIEKGESFSKSLSAYSTVFPPMVFQMIAVGEKTGRLEEVLFYLAEFFEDEVDTATKNLSTILEPVLLIAIGIVVGGVALAIITPLYQLTASLKIR